MIKVIPIQDEPSYEELQQKCRWLQGSLREARRSYQDAQKWRMALLLTSTVSTVLLVLTWAGYIKI